MMRDQIRIKVSYIDRFLRNETEDISEGYHI
jgi:hypothetical protein